MARKLFLFIKILTVMLCFMGGSSEGVGADMVVDEIGRQVAVPRHPQRIVSLAPNITETLFDLGLEDRVVGVSTFSDYPEAARRKPKVGSYVNLSLEKIVSLGPDLIIGTANGNKKETVLQLERVGYAVYVINPVTFDDIFKSIRHIGQITGRKEISEELIETLTARVDTVASTISGLRKPRVFFQIGIDPIVTVGKNTVHNTLIDLAGGINVTGDVAMEYPRLSMEKVVFARPDIIIISSMKRGGNFENVRDMWKQWKDIPAVKHDRIHIINSDLTDHSSPRIVDGLEELVRIIHPEQTLGNRKNE
jgi:iron complex transport system substrate-binding protein